MKRSIIILILIFFFCPVFAGDQPVSIRIQSVYMNPNTGSWDQTMNWEIKSDNGRLFTVWNVQTDTAVAELEYDNGRLQQIKKQLNSGNAFTDIVDSEKNAVYLSDGYPVPIDDVNPTSLTDEQHIVRKKAGGMTFSTILQKTVTAISPDSPQVSAMINPSLKGLISGNLNMITLSKNGQLLVRQLWQPGDHWWIYEETPARKSWRVNTSF